MKAILQDDMPELDEIALSGIVGAVAAYTATNLEEISNMQLTLHEYAIISPARADLNVLLENRSLGAYSHTLCVLMYRMGQQNAQTETGERQSQSLPGLG